MTIVFQILAIVVIVVAAFFMLRGGGDRHQAIRRILMLLFIVAAASSVVFPQLWTLAAHLVGVGRGTDLLLYFTVLIFIGFVATTYRRFRQIERDVTQLARKLALLEARERAVEDRSAGTQQDPPADS
jgi:hypothetical protein